MAALRRDLRVCAQMIIESRICDLDPSGGDKDVKIGTISRRSLVCIYTDKQIGVLFINCSRNCELLCIAGIYGRGGIRGGRFFILCINSGTK